MTFLDTNILVYAVDKLDAAKQALAMAIVADAISRPGFMVSAQVLLVAAAEANHCDAILTEDLNDGQVYCGVRAVNPFEKGVAK